MPKWENRCKIAVSGVGYSKVTRSADLPLAAHALEAVAGAIADCGLKLEDIDGLSTYPELPATGHSEVDGISIVSVNCMMAMLKLPSLTWHMQVGSNNIGGAVQQAANALLAGVCRYAVVWRAMHNPKGTYQNLPGAQAAGATQFTGPYGFGGPGQHMAVAYTRYLERHNQSRDKMVTLALTQRQHTQHNPHAYFYGTPLTREDYFNSRMVAYPFCLYDCDIPVQGAVAVVLTTAERARDLRPKPAYLASYGQRLHFEVAGRIGSLADYMQGGASSAKLTWERSGFSPKDVDVAQIYDGFSASVIYGLESYGFCQEGEALDFIQGGRVALDGELPLNTFGGSLGTGRIHGLWHIIEGALQASGRAGSRQVKDVNVSFVGASAPIVTGTTFIFTREPY
jgi:acetyl-CoA acetyltransferase